MLIPVLQGHGVDVKAFLFCREDDAQHVFAVVGGKLWFYQVPLFQDKPAEDCLMKKVSLELFRCCSFQESFDEERESFDFKICCLGHLAFWFCRARGLPAFRVGPEKVKI